ncbi:MAG: site-2 protease family protein [Pirellulaceae bacterium]
MSFSNQPDPPELQPFTPPLDVGDIELPANPLELEVPPPTGPAALERGASQRSSLPAQSTQPKLAVDERAADQLELSPQTWSPQTMPPPRARRVRLPVILFLVTGLSTFWVGVNHWLPFPFGITAWELLMTDWAEGLSYMAGILRQVFVAHWKEGLIYMACVMAILLTHEMGHFLATLRYRIPASLPFFIPFPISPIGTMGAVIGMDGLRANRREMFDIGLAGPLAGLLVAVPIMCIGIAQLDLTQMAYGPFAVDLPLFARLAMQYIQPPGYEPGKLVWFSQLNPYFMAGWVGFLITGLNMLPVSQLDGGHVIYTLFGRRAHWIARGFMLAAVAFVVISQQWNWMVMIALVFFIGMDHPPTKDDDIPLGRVRTLIGCLAILIPVFCFAPWLFIFPV